MEVTALWSCFGGCETIFHVHASQSHNTIDSVDTWLCSARKLRGLLGINGNNGHRLPRHSFPNRLRQDSRCFGLAGHLQTSSLDWKRPKYSSIPTFPAIYLSQTIRNLKVSESIQNPIINFDQPKTLTSKLHFPATQTTTSISKASAFIHHLPYNNHNGQNHSYQTPSNWRQENN